MSKRILTTLIALAVLPGCVKEITSEERLERETKRSNSMGSATAAELLKLRCADVTAELTKARDESAPEDKRISTYSDLFDRVKERTTKFEDALARNPDLAYQEGSSEIISARDSCIDAQTEVRNDFENLVREIVQVPVVDDYKDGKAVKAARMDFGPLRDAIEQLDLDDKDSLNARLDNAEKTVEVKNSTPTKRRGKK